MDTARRFLLSLVLVMAMLTAALYSVGTATVTPNVTGSVSTYAVAWTSTAGGAVSGNPFTATSGKIEQIYVTPGAGGTQPTDLYDLTILNGEGVDILNGEGANLSNATGRYFLAEPPVRIANGTTLDVVIANAGSAKTGTVTIWVVQ